MYQLKSPESTGARGEELLAFLNFYIIQGAVLLSTHSQRLGSGRPHSCTLKPKSCSAAQYKQRFFSLCQASAVEQFCHTSLV